MTILDDRVPAPAVGTERYHSGSHRRLLTQVAAAPGRRPLNAIIVPTIHPASTLTSVIALARRVNAALLVLCSGKAWASEVAALAGRDRYVTAVDVTGLRRLMPAFETTDIHRRTQRHPLGDLSL